MLEEIAIAVDTGQPCDGWRPTVTDGVLAWEIEGIPIGADASGEVALMISMQVWGAIRSALDAASQAAARAGDTLLAALDSLQRSNDDPGIATVTLTRDQWRVVFDAVSKAQAANPNADEYWLRLQNEAIDVIRPHLD
jgi:hypothetical protein